MRLQILFLLLHNNSLKSKTQKWVYVEGLVFPHFYLRDEWLNSVESFKKSFKEYNLTRLFNTLLEEPIHASGYGTWIHNEEETIKMVDDFVTTLFNTKTGDKYRIFSDSQYGMIGLFVGFIFINITKQEISFFVKDDCP